MKRLTTIVLLVMVASALAASVAYAQTAQPTQSTEIKDVLSGKVFPLTLQLKDLNDQWQRMTIETQGASTAWATYFALFTGVPAVYYSKGESISLAGETFLVAYRVPTKPMTYAELTHSSSSPTELAKLLVKLTPETKLSLGLLNWNSVVSVTDIRPFNLEQEINESGVLSRTEQTDATASATEAALSSLMKLAFVIDWYTLDHNEKLPPMQGPDALKKALSPYLEDESVLVQPETHESYRPNPVLSGKKKAHIKYPDQMIMLYQPSPDSDGRRWVLFLDGHFDQVTAAQWEHFKKLSKLP